MIMVEAPTGTVTFLFTDVEASSLQGKQSGAELQAARAEQERIIRTAVGANGGLPYKMVGDAFQAAFATAPQAVQAAIDSQRALQASTCEPGSSPLMQMRMALHTGVVEVRRTEQGVDYTGPLLNRVARLLAAGHGGQILLTLASAELVRDNLPAGVGLIDMGEHRLRDLFRPERVFQVTAPGLPSQFQPLKTLENQPSNLPTQPTPFLGREREVGEVKATLMRDDVSLLTLIGPGGVGKTRLALQAAADLLDEFEDGVFLVPLAPISDPMLVVPTIAHNLGVQEASGEPLLSTLQGYLRDKHLLLVLDNFEQVLDAAPQVAQLIVTSEALKVLATSRASLHLSMEHQYPVPSLSLPDPRRLPPVENLSQYEAVALFIARAQAANNAFTVNNANAPAVAEICVRLDGLPLAIELAAARIKILSPQAILERLGSRLKLLRDGAKDLPARQQALRSTIEWSYDLLTLPEQGLFARLGIFAGGCTLEAAETVCSPQDDLELDALDGMASLVDKNLLLQREEAHGEVRFAMLETIREYAAERLEQSGDAGTLRQRHLDYFLTFAEETEPQLRGADQDLWLERLEREHDNLRLALGWSLQGGSIEAVEEGLRLVGALYRFWFMHSHLAEGSRWLQLALDKSSASEAQDDPGLSIAQKAARAKALNGLGALTWLRGDLDAALTQYNKSLTLWKQIGETKGVGTALNNMAVVAEEKGDYVQARALLEESLALKREIGDKAGIASSLGNLSSVVYELGDVEKARPLAEESLKLERELGNKMGIAGRLNMLGNIAITQNDLATARRLHEESLAIKQALGDKWGVSTSFHNLAHILISEGDYAKGRDMLIDSLRLTEEVGNKVAIPALIEECALLALEVGQPERAAWLYGAAHALRETLDAPLPGSDRSAYESYIARVREQLDDPTFSRAWAEGQAAGMEQAISYAIKET